MKQTQKKNISLIIRWWRCSNSAFVDALVNMDVDDMQSDAFSNFIGIFFNNFVESVAHLQYRFYLCTFFGLVILFYFVLSFFLLCFACNLILLFVFLVLCGTFLFCFAFLILPVPQLMGAMGGACILHLLFTKVADVVITDLLSVSAFENYLWSFFFFLLFLEGIFCFLADSRIGLCLICFLLPCGLCLLFFGLVFYYCN